MHFCQIDNKPSRGEFTEEIKKINADAPLAQLIRNEKVGCSIHLSGTKLQKGSLL